LQEDEDDLKKRFEKGG
jgi:hypothetical protein